MDENLNEEVTDLVTCSRCDEEVAEEYTNETQDDGLVCDKCYSDYHRCEGCNKKYHEDDMRTASDDYYCDDCFSDLLFCEHCEEYVPTDEGCTVHARSGDEIWCDSCVDNQAWYCDGCSERHSDYYSSYHIRGSNINVCEDCRDNIHYFECVECNEDWHADYCTNPNDDNDNWICSNCARNGGGRINNYSYKPRAVFFKADGQNVNERNDLFFGIELEVEQKDSSVSRYDITKRIEHESYYFKSDGSLDNGFEIVTHPMTFEYIHQHKTDIFQKALDTLIANGYRSYDSNTCGIHIHLSKKAFGTWQLYRFIKFFIDNKEFVVAISQRKPDQLERWSAIEEETNSELIYKAKKKNGDGQRKRYVAVNLQNDRTVEIRLFRGTLNIQSFMKNVEFCYALFSFTRDCNDTSLDKFKEYIDKSNDYSMLKKFIKLKNI